MNYWETLRKAVGPQQIILNGAAGAIIKDGKILLARKDSASKWHIPGGLQELNESLQETVEREIEEELGLRLRAEKLISVYSDSKWLLELSNGDKIQQVTFFFLMAGDFEESDIVLQNTEIGQYAFFRFGEVPAFTMDCCKEKVKDLLAFHGETILR